MKKFTIVFLILLSLLFSMVKVPVYAVNIFKEGVYKAADFNFSPDNLYSVQNISPTDNVYLIIFDKNQLAIQSIRLDPKSPKYNLLPLKPDYRIIIVGNGEVFINELKSTISSTTLKDAYKSVFLLVTQYFQA